jgi:glycosyltransferase involved in cell wall biosynthesis
VISVYVLATHIPIYIDGDTSYLENGWFRDVLLARDWLASPFGGRLALLAPCRPAFTAPGSVTAVHASMGIQLVPGMDDRCRAREFWRTERKRWNASLKRILPEAHVLHTAIADLYRPMQQLAFAAARRAGVTTVLIGPDTDPHEELQQEVLRGPWAQRVRARLYLAAFDAVYQHELRHADLALLKEGAVWERYGRFAAHAHAFCHTMYSRSDVITQTELDARTSSLRDGRALRLVYCGRLLRRKGLHFSLQVIERALREGAQLEFDIIGGGPEETALKKQVDVAGLGSQVRFLGAIPYGPALIRNLRRYDLLMFTSAEEETPRMVYDGYAAGLPIIATEIPFMSHRAAADGAAVTFAIDDAASGAALLTDLWRDPRRLRELSNRAQAAGLHHAIETWYARRRAWTIEAVERRRQQHP